MPSKNNLEALKGREGSSVLPDTQPPPETPEPPPAKTKIKRVNKGFQVEQSRAQRWDMLVAFLKAQGINGPQLIDEALDDLFKKYNI